MSFGTRVISHYYICLYSKEKEKTVRHTSYARYIICNGLQLTIVSVSRQMHLLLRMCVDRAKWLTPSVHALFHCHFNVFLRIFLSEWMHAWVFFVHCENIHVAIDLYSSTMLYHYVRDIFVLFLWIEWWKRCTCARSSMTYGTWLVNIFSNKIIGEWFFFSFFVGSQVCLSCIYLWIEKSRANESEINREERNDSEQNVWGLYNTICWIAWYSELGCP